MNHSIRRARSALFSSGVAAISLIFVFTVLFALSPPLAIAKERNGDEIRSLEPAALVTGEVAADEFGAQGQNEPIASGEVGTCVWVIDANGNADGENGSATGNGSDGVGNSSDESSNTEASGSGDASANSSSGKSGENNSSESGLGPSKSSSSSAGIASSPSASSGASNSASAIKGKSSSTSSSTSTNSASKTQSKHTPAAKSSVKQDNRTSIAKAIVRLSAGTFTYDGKAKTPGVEVRLGKPLCVEMRAFQTVDGKIYRSSWSKPKRVRLKK